MKRKNRKTEAWQKTRLSRGKEVIVAAYFLVLGLSLLFTGLANARMGSRISAQYPIVFLVFLWGGMPCITKPESRGSWRCCC